MRVQHRAVHNSRRDVCFLNMTQFEHQTLGHWNPGVYSFHVSRFPDVRARSQLEVQHDISLAHGPQVR